MWDTSLYLMMKTERMEEFERTGLLLGSEGLARLGTSTVAVFGVGGVGSHCIEALARSGVGRLFLVERRSLQKQYQPPERGVPGDHWNI